jgi:hypothetical protein
MGGISLNVVFFVVAGSCVLLREYTQNGAILRLTEVSNFTRVR